MFLDVLSIGIVYLEEPFQGTVRKDHRSPFFSSAAIPPRDQLWMAMFFFCHDAAPKFAGRGGIEQMLFHCSNYLVVHPTDRGCGLVHPSYFSGHCPYLSHWNNQGELTHWRSVGWSSKSAFWCSLRCHNPRGSFTTWPIDPSLFRACPSHVWWHRSFITLCLLCVWWDVQPPSAWGLSKLPSAKNVGGL